MTCGPKLSCPADDAGIPVASGKPIFSGLGLDYGFAGFAEGSKSWRGMLEQAALGPDRWCCTSIASPGVRGVSGSGGHSGEQDRCVGPKGLSAMGGRHSVSISRGRLIRDNCGAACCSSD